MFLKKRTVRLSKPLYLEVKLKSENSWWISIEYHTLKFNQKSDLQLQLIIKLIMLTFVVIFSFKISLANMGFLFQIYLIIWLLMFRFKEVEAFSDFSN